MSTSVKNTLKEVMNLAWQFIKRNGYSKSEALRTAWANIKLKAAMKGRIVKFWYQKIDGSIREAYGTLNERLMSEIKGTNRRVNDSVQVYFDTEKHEYRCFKKANIIKFA